jgi:hypothetical protein
MTEEMINALTADMPDIQKAGLPYTPADWYWERAGGTLYSSKRSMEIAATDAEYLAWVESGGIPTQFPKDTHGNESYGEMLKVLTGDHAADHSDITTLKDMQNFIIRARRAEIMTAEADPLKYGYEEDLARYGADDSRTRGSLSAWLVKKDEIRAMCPYVE